MSKLHHQEQVNLYEDNAGGLHMIHGGVQWSGFEYLAEDANAAMDAQCILDGETTDWTMDRHEPADVERYELIATYSGGKLRIDADAHIGVAGRRYLHI